MIKKPIALQVYSVREDAAADFAGTMKKIREMGYDGVELAGLYGMTAAQVKSVLDDVGLTAVSAHVPINELLDDLEQTLDTYQAIGFRYIAIPFLDETMRPGTDGFARVLAAIPDIGRACQSRGMTLLYHNHDFEFVRMDDGQYGLDALYAAVPADLLQTELDTCWVNVAGENPADYVRKYAGRCPVVHLKDFWRDENQEDEGDLYELIGQEEKKKSSRRGFEFRPVGHGLQDMPAIITAAQESGAEWLVVEQDQSVGRPPLEAVQMSIEYLRGL